MPALKNPKHEIYAKERAKGATQVGACVTAGYSEKSAKFTANKIEKRKDVQERIANLLAEKANQDQLATQKAVDALAKTREDVLRELWDNAMKAKQGEPVYDRQGNPTGEWVAAFNASNKALELFGREAFGMFVNVSKVIHSPFDDMGFDAAQALLNEIDALITAQQSAEAGRPAPAPKQPRSSSRTTH